MSLIIHFCCMVKEELIKHFCLYPNIVKLMTYIYNSMNIYISGITVIAVTLSDAAAMSVITIFIFSAWSSAIRSMWQRKEPFLPYSASQLSWWGEIFFYLGQKTALTWLHLLVRACRILSFFFVPVCIQFECLIPSSLVKEQIYSCRYWDFVA